MEIENKLSQIVYHQVKEKIIRLELPPALQLKERMLSRDLQIGRTPVREALQRLFWEGWVIAVDKKLFVKDLVLKDIQEIFQFRKIIEPFAVERIFALEKARLVAGKIDEIVSKMKHFRQDLLEYVLLDLACHKEIICYFENEPACRFWQVISEEVCRLSVLTLRVQQNFESGEREHFELAEAFWDRDKDAVIKKLCRHYDEAAGRMEDALLAYAPDRT